MTHNLCLVSFQAKRKSQSSQVFHHLFASWTIPWLVVIRFLMSLYLPLKTTIFIFSWFWLNNRHNPHIFIFPAPKLWRNFLCLFKLRLNVSKKSHSSQMNCLKICLPNEIFQVGIVMRFLVSLYLPLQPSSVADTGGSCSPILSSNAFLTLLNVGTSIFLKYSLDGTSYSGI